ncbi:MAG: glucosamine-6-phosphate deaminase [Clostridia bacterium]|nr:glucosamine-6-phosphate deaminase [Clostridia bacterium]
MKVIRTKSYEEMSRVAADVIGAQIIMKNDCLLGLATGTTPLGTYAELASRCAAGELDFSKVRTVNLDEYKGLAPDHVQSYRYFMDKHLFDLVNIDKANTRVPDGLAEDSAAMGLAYDEYIESVGGIDLQLLGIGHDGHIGFNEPDDCFTGPTHLVDLTEMTIDANSRLFESRDEVPRQAVTMGMKSIMQAKKILMVVNGEEKKEILKAALYGEITPQVPASLIQLHPDVTVVTDIEDI